ncbi:MAG: hypothetical protein IPP94_04755 [Ignavibacteria bacterium]|nr:hypothetical protein [Ignavibacteria bacterium]
MTVLFPSRYFASLLLFLLSIPAAAPMARASGHAAPAAAPRLFIPNDGRLLDTDGRLRDDVLYSANLQGMRIYLRRDGVSYVFAEQTDGARHDGRDAHSCAVVPHRASSRAWRMDVAFDGMNPRATVRQDGVPLSYTGTIAREANGSSVTRRLALTASVVYENIYAHIDLVFRITALGLKYDFIVRPGGRVSDIRMRYSGSTALTIGEDGALSAATPLGAVREHAPVVFQEHATGAQASASRRDIPAAYVLDGDILRFAVGAHDGARPLTIDPFVEWATYCGGRSTEFATSTAIDGAGNVLVSGWTESDNFPATAGAWQTLKAGKADGFVAKFAPDGAPLWITFCGGAEDDIALGIAARPNGDIAVSGYTYSADFPASVTAFQPVKNGLSDGFLLQLAPDGTMRWATFLGGQYEDEASAVAFDSQGNMVLTGRTLSSTFPSTFGAFQFTNRGGFDAFIAKFRADGTRIWSTYYGGSVEEWGHAIATDPMDNIVVSGHTESGDFPVTPGAFQGGYIAGGFANRMGFMLRFSSSGARVFATYLGGDNFSDAYGITADRAGNLLVSGATNGGGFPVSPGAYKVAVSGSKDAFIGKFAPDGTRQWLTLYGGSGEDVGYAISAFPSGNMMIAGSTGSPDFPVTPDAAQAAYGGGVLDAFALKFRKDGTPAWSTFLGGSRIELENDKRGLAGIATHWTGVASMTGWTSSADFPTTPGAFQTTAPMDGTWEGFIVKFGCAVAPPPAIVANGSRQFCEGGSVVLDAGPGYALYAWSTGDSTRSITVSASGSYTVSVIDTNDCGGTSPAVAVTVHPLPAPLVLPLGPTTFCAGDSVRLDAGAFASYAWSNGDTTRLITVKASGTFTVSVRDSNGCAGQSPAIPVVVNPLPVVAITASGPVSFCEGGTVDLDAGAGFKTYRWSTGAVTRRITVNAAGSYSVAVTNDFDCGATSTPVTVTVFPLPRPVIVITGDTVFCEGDSVRLDAGAGFASYRWSNSATSQSIIVKATGTFFVTVTDGNSCANASRPVSVTVNPKPTSVITPLGRTAFCDGDSVILDAGAGFASYRWSTGAVTRTITVKQTGAHQVTVAFATGCATASVSVPVTVFPNPAPIITPGGPVVFCDGDSVVLSAPPGFARYRWSTGETTQRITVKTSMLATVTVEDVNGCTGVAPSLLVTVNPLPQRPVVTQRLDTLFSTPETSWQWNAGGVPISGATGPFLLIPRSGTYTVTVRNVFGCEATSAPLSVTIARATVSLPVIEAAPGERVTIPLQLLSSDGLSLSGAKNFTAEIRFDKDLLVPVSAGNWSVQGSERVLSLQGSWPDTTGTLATFECMAMLGKSASMPLRIAQFAWTAGAVYTTRVDGEFRLAICRDGGDRLFDGDARLAMAQNRPNPFNASTVIDYEILERGPARLTVTDLLGREVAVLFDGIAEPGAYTARFDAAALPTGLYHATLVTAGATIRRTMVLAK